MHTGLDNSLMGFLRCHQRFPNLTIEEDMECDKIDVTLGKLVCFFVTPIFRDYLRGGIKDQVEDFYDHDLLLLFR
jgi:hypothetical protein